MRSAAAPARPRPPRQALALAVVTLSSLAGLEVSQRPANTGLLATAWGLQNEESRAAPPAVGLPPLDRARIGWSAARLSASKLTITATSDVELRTVDRALAAAELYSPPEHPGLPACEPTILVTIDSSGLGRRTVTELWIDPDRAAALQRRQLESGGGRDRFKIHRFTPDGVFNRRRKPGEQQKKDLPQEEWAFLNEWFDPYPAGARDYGAISDASALFYIVATAPLDHTGDRVTVPIYTHGNVVLAELVVEGVNRIEVDYVEQSAAGERRVQGTADALRISVGGRFLAPPDQDDEQLELLGLHGDVEVFLDRTSRAPLEVTGHLQVVGRTRIRLERLTLRS